MISRLRGLLWTFSKRRIFSMPLNNHVELAEYWCGYSLREGERPQDVVDKWVFKETRCGAWCKLEDDRVTFGSIVEGYDYEPETHTLMYPINPLMMMAKIARIEADVDEFLAEVEHEGL
jgi:hypothetical protein